MAFRQGLADRKAWEDWFAGTSGDYRNGALYWTGQRSTPHPGSCTTLGGDATAGCLAAKVRLDASDARRKREPEYRQGWNSHPTDDNSTTGQPQGTGQNNGEASIPGEQQAGGNTASHEIGHPRRGWLGVRIQQVTPEIAESVGLQEASGAIVAVVNDGGPADTAKIRDGDVILKFNGLDVKDVHALPRIVANSEMGKQVPVVLWRDGKEVTVLATLAEKPDDATVSPERTGGGKLDAPKPVELSGLGITIAPISPELRDKYHLDSGQNGVVITEVTINSSAAERGLKAGDVIVKVQQGEVTSPSDVQKQFDSEGNENRRSVLMLIQRQDGRQWVPLPLPGVFIGTQPNTTTTATAEDHPKVIQVTTWDGREIVVALVNMDGIMDDCEQKVGIIKPEGVQFSRSGNTLESIRFTDENGAQWSVPTNIGELSNAARSEANSFIKVGKTYYSHIQICGSGGFANLISLYDMSISISANSPPVASSPAPTNLGETLSATSPPPPRVVLTAQAPDADWSEKVNIAKDKMTKCLQKLPKPDDGIERHVERVIKSYIALCGQDFISVWRQGGPTEEESTAAAMVYAYEAVGCRYSNPTQADRETMPEGSRSISCSPQDRVGHPQ